MGRKAENFVITIKVRSEEGTAPVIQVLCGDTVFLNLQEGQSASWSVKRVPEPTKESK